MWLAPERWRVFWRRARPRRQVQGRVQRRLWCGPARVEVAALSVATSTGSACCCGSSRARAARIATRCSPLCMLELLRDWWRHWRGHKAWLFPRPAIRSNRMSTRSSIGPAICGSEHGGDHSSAWSRRTRCGIVLQPIFWSDIDIRVISAAGMRSSTRRRSTRASPPTDARGHEPAGASQSAKDGPPA